MPAVFTKVNCKAMQRYLLFQLLFCIFSVSLSDSFYNDYFFHYTFTNSCDNQTSREGNCSNGHIIHKELENSTFSLQLKLYDDNYRITLREYDSSILASNANVTVQDKKLTWKASNVLDLPLYEGTDENGTYACGLLKDGVFNGFLMLRNGSSVYIESLKEQNISDSNASVPLIVYKANDVKFRDCSSLKSNESCHENGFSGSVNCQRETKRKISCFLNSNLSALRPHFTSNNILDKSKNRPLYTFKHATCSVLVRSDSSFFALHNNDLESAVSEIVLVFKQVNHILRSSDFDNDGKPDRFSLRIVGIILMNDTRVNDTTHDKESLSKLMEDFRNKPQDDCLSLMFVGLPTNSNFISSVYGGGICRTNEKESEPAKNVAIINTMDSKGYTRPFFATAWTTAMAIGQVMGSAERTCDSILPFPPEEDWTSFFSDCGRHNIANVLEKHGSCLEFLEDKARFRSKPRLKEKVLKTSCGNGQVDPGEECDCGTEKNCSKIRSCCLPPGEQKECQYDRSKGYECDWSDDCCTRDCKIVPITWNVFCGNGDSSCFPKGAHCNGVSPHCPVPRSAVRLKDGEQCSPANFRQAGASTCKRGLCNGTVCQDAGLQDCTCAASTGQQCRVCCKQNDTDKKENKPSVCVPAEYFGLKSKQGIYFYRYQGTPCSEARFGHCDKYGACVPFQTIVDSTGTIHERYDFIIAMNIISVFVLFCYY